MRHFLRRELGRTTLPRLPRGVLDRTPTRALVLGAGATNGLATPDCSAIAGAVNVAAITVPADADLLRAARAAEDPMVFDHPEPCR
jgi:hypothetical protein